MSRILVTGATGFVGACLTRRLAERGYEVHYLVRKESNKWRISDLIGHITEHEVDLRDYNRLEKTISTIRPTIIYHLATYGGFAFQKDSGAIIESNLNGTMNLLKACEKVGFDLFVNTGSSSEYGIKTGPMIETDLLEPIGDYGVSKAATTLFCRAAAIEKRLPIITLRLFSPYGQWDDPKRLIPYVIKSLLRGEAPKLSTPASVRDYIFIEDVLDLYLGIMNKQFSGGEIYNLGSGVQYSIGEVVQILNSIIGNGVQPAWGTISGKRPEPSVWVADITKTKDKLDWNPSTSIQTGLENTIEWFKRNLEIYL